MVHWFSQSVSHKLINASLTSSGGWAYKTQQNAYDDELRYTGAKI